PVEPKDQIIQPHQFILHGNFPNPFNPTTTLTFTLPVASSVTLEVFDISGSRVGVGLAPTRVGFRQGVPSGGESDLQWYPPGIHAITFDGGDLPSGIYFARLLTEDFQQTQKLVLLK
ncbi:T9SS type A sorting domain-containing protein, partial [bacterium]|nr:T9SS type A sorting domain-containing protein [bacterium]